jgi:8-oxo-dGTP pyrophosphatase MutT (NUDIX family)
MSSDSVVSIEYVDLIKTSWTWPFAVQRRCEIANYFTELQRSNPALWNGKVLLLRDFDLQGSVLRGHVFETDYASLQAAIDWEAMGEVKACFGAAALVTPDQAYVVGVMAPHTRNAGQIYFPSGSLDPEDLAGTSVDLRGSVNRELIEETGLSLDEFEEQSGWYAVFAGPRIAIVKIFHASETGEALRDRIRTSLAMQMSPEFSDIQLVRRPADLNSSMPPWLAAFFAYIWR